MGVTSLVSDICEITEFGHGSCHWVHFDPLEGRRDEIVTVENLSRYKSSQTPFCKLRVPTMVVAFLDGVEVENSISLTSNVQICLLFVSK